MLARGGRRVALFERDRFPRFHIGESLLATSNEAFEKLGLREKVASAGFTRKWGASFGPGDGSSESYADFTVSPRSHTRRPGRCRVSGSTSCCSSTPRS